MKKGHQHYAMMPHQDLPHATDASTDPTQLLALSLEKSERF
jgi:hypothetical protein